MKIITETSLSNFEAWSGAIDTLDRIISEGMEDKLEAILEDMYPEGMTDTELNDLLWFEPDTIFEWLGMRTESQIREELEEAQEELEEIKEELERESEELREEFDNIKEAEKAVKKLREDYSDSMTELEEKIAELEEELENI